MGDDLRYIEDLINGNVGQDGSEAHGQRGRGGRRSRRVSTQTGETAQHLNTGQGPRNNQGSRNRHATTSAAGTAPSPSPQADDEEDQKYNTPSEKSTEKVLHCATCDVWVPCRPGDWSCHVDGIRHRRHVLSIREYGERGRLVLSAFESDPRAGEPSHRIAGKASAAEFGLDPGASGSGFSRKQQRQQQGGKQKGGAQQPIDPEYAELKAMHTEAMTRCLGIYGTGHIYNVVDTFFNIDRLREAKKQVDSLGTNMPPYQCINAAIAYRIEELRQALINPAAVLYLAHRLREQQRSGPTTAPAPESAAAEQATQFLLPPVVIITMNYNAYTSDYFGAWLCSLQSFVHALAANPNQVVRLGICVTCDLDRHLQETLRKGWDKILNDIENVLLAENATLRGIHFYLVSSAFSVQPWMDWTDADSEDAYELVDGYMVNNMDRFHRKLEKKAKETAAACRLAVLMSQHPRLGRLSILQLLPARVLPQIVKEAVLKEGCGISVDNIGPAARFKYKAPTWEVEDYEDADRNDDEEDRTDSEEEEEEYMASE